VHPEPVDLRPFILTVASEVEPLLAERGLDLSIAAGSTLPRVHTDPMHLRQILVNLLANAVKFTPTGTIAVRARVVDVDAALAQWPRLRLLLSAPGAAVERSRAWVAVQVTDSGIGIPAGDHERIFEEFEQVNAGPRGDSMQRGTGLGLAISRRLARLLGGDVTVESELGRGSTFTLWLPAERPGEGGASPASVEAPEPAAARGG
jgi:signal transduction histidine kinase